MTIAIVYDNPIYGLRRARVLSSALDTRLIKSIITDELDEIPHGIEAIVFLGTKPEYLITIAKAQIKNIPTFSIRGKLPESRPEKLQYQNSTYNFYSQPIDGSEELTIVGDLLFDYIESISVRHLVGNNGRALAPSNIDLPGLDVDYYEPNDNLDTLLPNICKCGVLVTTSVDMCSLAVVLSKPVYLITQDATPNYTNGVEIEQCDVRPAVIKRMLSEPLSVIPNMFDLGDGRAAPRMTEFIRSRI